MGSRIMELLQRRSRIKSTSPVTCDTRYGWSAGSDGYCPSEEDKHTRQTAPVVGIFLPVTTLVGPAQIKVEAASSDGRRVSVQSKRCITKYQLPQSHAVDLHVINESATLDISSVGVPPAESTTSRPTTKDTNGKPRVSRRVKTAVREHRCVCNDKSLLTFPKLPNRFHLPILFYDFLKFYTSEFNWFANIVSLRGVDRNKVRRVVDVQDKNNMDSEHLQHLDLIKWRFRNIPYRSTQLFTTQSVVSDTPNSSPTSGNMMDELMQTFRGAATATDLQHLGLEDEKWPDRVSQPIGSSYRRMIPGGGLIVVEDPFEVGRNLTARRNTSNKMEWWESVQAFICDEMDLALNRFLGASEGNVDGLMADILDSSNPCDHWDENFVRRRQWGGKKKIDDWGDNQKLEKNSKKDDWIENKDDKIEKNAFADLSATQALLESSGGSN